MPEEEIRAKVRRIMEGAYSQGNLDALAGLYAADVLYHRPPLADLEGLKALREYVSDLRRAFSNVRFTVNRIILSEDAFALLWTLQGQHSGRSPALPIPPTGRQATMTGCTAAHWAEGMIDEAWAYADWLSLFWQLGVMPPMG